MNERVKFLASGAKLLAVCVRSASETPLYSASNVISDVDGNIWIV